MSEKIEGVQAAVLLCFQSLGTCSFHSEILQTLVSFIVKSW